MPELAKGRKSRASIGRLVLGLTVFGLLLVFHVFPSNTQHHYKTSPSPSTLNRMPNSMADRHEAVLLDPEHSAGAMGKLFVDRLHPRHLSPTTEAGSIAEDVHEKREQEASHKTSSDDKNLATNSQISARGKGNCGVCGNTDKGPNYDEKSRKRSPLKWTEHRGPPKKHSPKTNIVATAEPVVTALRESQKELSINAGSDIVQRTATKNPHTGKNVGTKMPKPSAPEVPNDKTTESHHAGITPRLERKLRCLCGPDICNTDPDRCKSWRWWPRRSDSETNVITDRSANDTHELGDKKALLAHSKSTSNENLQKRRETASVTMNKEKFEAHHSELVPRRLICDCGTYICTKYRSTCKRWKQVPDRKRSVLNAPAESRNQQQQQQLDTVTPRASTKGPKSGEKHYIPAYWKNNDRADATMALKPNKISRAEKVSRQDQHNQIDRNSTYSKPTHSPGGSIADVFLPKKCNGTTKDQLHQCESTHQASIIFYSLLGIFVTSILLLALLKCHMCVRRRRNVATAKNAKIRHYDKSVTSSHPSFAGDSLASKREKNGFNAGGSQRYINLDGADDSWPKHEHGRAWNIFSRSVSDCPGSLVMTTMTNTV